MTKIEGSGSGSISQRHESAVRIHTKMSGTLAISLIYGTMFWILQEAGHWREVQQSVPGGEREAARPGPGYLPLSWRWPADKVQRTLLYDQCCGSGMFIRIPDPNFFPSRIRIREFKYFNPKKWFHPLGNMIRVVHSGSWLFTHPGSRIQGSKRHRIPDSDPQHCGRGPWFSESWSAYRHCAETGSRSRLYSSGSKLDPYADTFL